MGDELDSSADGVTISPQPSALQLLRWSNLNIFQRCITIHRALRRAGKRLGASQAIFGCLEGSTLGIWALQVDFMVGFGVFLGAILGVL